MAFDKSKPYGESLGGVTHGFFVQDGVIWHPSGEYAVDENGKKLATVPQKTSAPAKQVQAADDSVLASQLKD
jgi:hypothetical protein